MRRTRSALTWVATSVVTLVAAVAVVAATSHGPAPKTTVPPTTSAGAVSPTASPTPAPSFTVTHHDDGSDGSYAPSGAPYGGDN